MAESVYKIIELVGTSTESWEKAAYAAVGRAFSPFAIFGSPRSPSRHADRGRKSPAYRAKVKVSFKYEGGE